MQAALSILITLIAALYLANRWLPHKVKKHVMQLFGKKITMQSKGACSSCSSCGNCASTLPKSVKGVVIVHNK